MVSTVLFVCLCLFIEKCDSFEMFPKKPPIPLPSNTGKVTDFSPTSAHDIASLNLKVMESVPDLDQHTCLEKCMKTEGCVRAIHCPVALACKPGMFCTYASPCKAGSTCGTCQLLGHQGKDLKPTENCKISKPGR